MPTTNAATFGDTTTTTANKLLKLLLPLQQVVSV